MDLNWLTIVEAHQGLKAGDFSSEELTRSCLKRVKETEILNNFITLTDELALEQAKAADADGKFENPLTGIPLGIKDLFNTKGVLSTSASGMLKDYVPPYESTATKRLLDVKYVMLGKVNLDDCACGTTTESSPYGPSLNPWNKDHVAGGSSGGSASGVAAGQFLGSLGTDTGGSIRLPASWSGCVGLKVTYGRVSRSGVTAMASSWDTIGPMARTVEDAALILQVIAGRDKYDATTPDVEVPNYTENLGKGIEGLTIGVPKEYFVDAMDIEVREAVEAAVKEYEKMGAKIKEVSLPSTKYGVAVYYVTMPGELSTNLARLDGIRYGHKPDLDTSDLIEYNKASRGEGFGAEIKRRIMVGTFVLSAGYADEYYKKALKVRTLIIQEFEEVFKDVDVLIAPVAPTTAFKVGENVNDPLANYLADVLTIPASAAGLPSLAMPCGFSKDGLPIGLQIIGPQWSESKLLQVGAAYEQAMDWKSQRPSI